MLKKIKNILGINGLKISIEVPGEVSAEQKIIRGKLHLHSKSDISIDIIKIKLIEKYQRGRNQETLIDEYLISGVEIDTDIRIEAEKNQSINFELPIDLIKSEVDRFGDKNILTKGITWVAKKLKNVNSYYRIQTEIKVEGNSLDFISKKPLLIN